MSDSNEKKAGHSPAFLWDDRKLRLGCAEAKDLPILHAATVPLDFVGWVAKFQQVLDVVGRLATPHAVAEQDGCLRIREVKQAFTFCYVEYILHNFRDVDRGSALGRIQLSPWNIDRAGNSAFGNPVRGAGVDHNDRGVTIAHHLGVMDNFTLGYSFNAWSQNSWLDAKRRAGTRGLGKGRVYGVGIVLVAGNVGCRTIVTHRNRHDVASDTNGLARLRRDWQGEDQAREDAEYSFRLIQFSLLFFDSGLRYGKSAPRAPTAFRAEIVTISMTASGKFENQSHSGSLQISASGLLSHQVTHSFAFVSHHAAGSSPCGGPPATAAGSASIEATRAAKINLTGYVIL